MSNDWGWLSELQTGDEVIVRTSQYGVSESVILKVRVTTKRVFVAVNDRGYEWEFRKDNGGEIGRHAYGPGRTLIAVTPENRAELELVRWRKATRTTLREMDWHQHSDETLRAVMALLTPTASVPPTMEAGDV